MFVDSKFGGDFNEFLRSQPDELLKLRSEMNDSFFQSIEFKSVRMSTVASVIEYFRNISHFESQFDAELEAFRSKCFQDQTGTIWMLSFLTKESLKKQAGQSEDIFKELAKPKPVHETIELLLQYRTQISSLMNYLQRNYQNSLYHANFDAKQFAQVINPTVVDERVSHSQLIYYGESPIKLQNVSDYDRNNLKKKQIEQEDIEIFRMKNIKSFHNFLVDTLAGSITDEHTFNQVWAIFEGSLTFTKNQFRSFVSNNNN
jgi:hypothetical protein